LMSETEPPRQGWLLYARTLARRNTQPSLTPPDWQEVRNLLDRAEKEGADRALVGAARAEVLAMQGQLAQAEKHVLKELGNLGEKTPLILYQAEITAAGGRSSEALDILRKYTTVEARIARIRYASQSGVQDADAVLQEGTREIDRLPPA